ncbi:TetR/AcrR family transcriptional regulator [[Mycobacterium] nativiensis]|uniref:TetR/AcrR family transcriptional regulator n=1 Tax=[Mycobacterium] nativiensis TaxID=2855503 RepID=A0ABU5XQV5_9MYCO|nr:TetR/AcrR family transcriptional regulator [Mycolicibacter sp. MYC340]MEB3030232.1 TetR/AcrR family transcriptional regulator [Mycolicibacter sp. MYC340]
MNEPDQAARALAQWQAAVPATQSAAGTRLNKRGLQTRERLLDVAIEVLAAGDSEPISANRIAKQAGVSWGTVQHQFGDLDGLWVAVVTEIHTRSWTQDGGAWPALTGSLAERLEAAIDSVWIYLETPEGRALTALRNWLPPRRADVLAEYPRTAAALAAREHDWIQGFAYLMDGLELDPGKLHNVRCLLPAAVRGLSSEREIGFSSELDVARRTLAKALSAYLS